MAALVLALAQAAKANAAAQAQRNQQTILAVVPRIQQFGESPASRASCTSASRTRRRPLRLQLIRPGTANAHPASPLHRLPSAGLAHMCVSPLLTVRSRALTSANGKRGSNMPPLSPGALQRAVTLIGSQNAPCPLATLLHVCGLGLGLGRESNCHGRNKRCGRRGPNPQHQRPLLLVDSGFIASTGLGQQSIGERPVVRSSPLPDLPLRGIKRRRHSLQGIGPRFERIGDVQQFVVRNVDLHGPNPVCLSGPARRFGGPSLCDSAMCSSPQH
jgi:hypothetical protein